MTVSEVFVTVGIAVMAISASLVSGILLIPLLLRLLLLPLLLLRRRLALKKEFRRRGTFFSFQDASYFPRARGGDDNYEAPL